MSFNRLFTVLKRLTLLAALLSAILSLLAGALLMSPKYLLYGVLWLVLLLVIARVVKHEKREGSLDV